MGLAGRNRTRPQHLSPSPPLNEDEVKKRAVAHHAVPLPGLPDRGAGGGGRGKCSETAPPKRHPGWDLI